MTKQSSQWNELQMASTDWETLLFYVIFLCLSFVNFIALRRPTCLYSCHHASPSTRSKKRWRWWLVMPFFSGLIVSMLIVHLLILQLLLVSSHSSSHLHTISFVSRWNTHVHTKVSQLTSFLLLSFFTYCLSTLLRPLNY